LSDACLQYFRQELRPVVTTYDVRIAIAEIFSAGEFEGNRIYSLEDVPTERDLRRVVTQLKSEHRISADPDFGSGVHRINDTPDGSAEDIFCLVNPFGYVSHLSAMERYGITDRISRSLIVTTLGRETWKEAAQDRVRKDRQRLGPFVDGYDRFKMKKIAIPDLVRGRPITAHSTNVMGDMRYLKSGFARIASIGQTFLDMVTKPNLCGGMRHVLEVWRDQSEAYMDEIVEAVDRSNSQIAKVRAGYILEEEVGESGPAIERWRKFAQRGSSRLLDPTKKFSPAFSESWMLSLNA
jgi:predicted transcriptional regulator of viral defense system